MHNMLIRCASASASQCANHLYMPRARDSSPGHSHEVKSSSKLPLPGHIHLVACVPCCTSGPPQSS
jgi:hypothetical protein